LSTISTTLPLLPNTKYSILPCPQIFQRNLGLSTIHSYYLLRKLRKITSNSVDADLLRSARTLFHARIGVLRILFLTPSLSHITLRISHSDNTALSAWVCHLPELTFVSTTPFLFDAHSPSLEPNLNSPRPDRPSDPHTHLFLIYGAASPIFNPPFVHLNTQASCLCRGLPRTHSPHRLHHTSPCAVPLGFPETFFLEKLLFSLFRLHRAAHLPLFSTESNRI